MVVGVALLVLLWVAVPRVVAAQETDPTVGEPTVVDEGQSPDEGPSRQTSDREIRLAVGGLVAIAVVTAVSTVFYWNYTGRDARARFAAERGPAPVGAPDVVGPESQIYLEHLFEVGQREVAAARRLGAQR